MKAQKNICPQLLTSKSQGGWNTIPGLSGTRPLLIHTSAMLLREARRAQQPRLATSQPLPLGVLHVPSIHPGSLG